ncbi:MAG: DUF2339 domain-containing protein [Desulfobulbaceae bacterium]|nr:DUF2339 domain-containing protein [Desulfobulbaceae bacterium]
MGNHVEGQVQGIEHLSEQVRILKDRVEQLSARLSALEGSEPSAAQVNNPGLQAVRPFPDNGYADTGLIDTTVLLPRVATVCFLLVIALILRTVTDNQIINTQAGSMLGMTYAGVLILMGWRLYAGKSRLAPVFPGCGILLLFSIVLETHAHYQSLSTLGAYSILFIAGGTIFAMSIRYRASALVSLGVPGTAAVAMAIDFPYPIYPILSILLLSAIIAASFAYKQGICRYLRWSTLAISVIFWMLWTSKVNMSSEPAAGMMYPTWFFPMLFIFWGVYLTTVVLNVLKKDLQLGFFESILPTITALGAFGAGHVAVNSGFRQTGWFYATMVVIATMHLALAWWLAWHDRERASGTNVFIFAGACLIVLTSAAVFNQIGYILPVWSASALMLAVLSASWRNEGVRITSYVLQIATCIAALTYDVVMVPAVVPVAAGITAFSLCLFSLVQYGWSRSHFPEQSHSVYFSRLDRKDLSAVVLLITGLLGGYYFFQFSLYQILSSMTTDFAFQYRSGQSLIINSGAVLLLYLGLRGRNKEIILMASIVALIGAGKVFILDLFGIKGMPLVLSVFSTGVVAAYGSVVLGRWQKKEAEPA